jgi:hypothetical protein
MDVTDSNTGGGALAGMTNLPAMNTIRMPTPAPTDFCHIRYAGPVKGPNTDQWRFMALAFFFDADDKVHFIRSERVLCGDEGTAFTPPESQAERDMLVAALKMEGEERIRKAILDGVRAGEYCDLVEDDIEARAFANGPRSVETHKLNGLRRHTVEHFEWLDKKNLAHAVVGLEPWNIIQPDPLLRGTKA